MQQLPFSIKRNHSGSIFSHRQQISKPSDSKQFVRKTIFNNPNLIESISEPVKDAGVFLIKSNDEFGKRSYASQINRELDARDQILNLPFKISLDLKGIKLTKNDVHKGFLNLVPDFKKQITQFLVEMLETIVSVSFNHLLQERLSQKQCKDYAAKNILLNVKKICEKLDPIINSLILEAEEKQIMKVEMTTFIDECLNRSLENLAGYYPQSTPKGASARMRKEIRNIDNREDEELDFLYLNDIVIKYREDGDYSPDLMNVINKVISLSGTIDQDDEIEETYFEKYQNFCENLFSLATLKREKDKEEILRTQVIQLLEKDIQRINIDHLSIIDQVFNKVIEPKNCSFENEESSKEKVELLRKISDFNSDKTTSQSSGKLKKDKLIITDQLLNRAICSLIYKSTVQNLSLSDELQERKEKILKNLKEKKQFLIGQKVPSNVKVYNEMQVRRGKITSNHSSILRIITKWAELLTNIFLEPAKLIKDKVYKFKTNEKKELIFLNSKERLALYEVLLQKRKDLRVLQEHLLMQNKQLQSQFLFGWQNNEKESEFIKRFTKVRITSSKMNTILTRYMSAYVIGLIKLLNEVPRQAKLKWEPFYQSYRNLEQINLISFRIGDLMRSKLECSERTFIDTLKIIDQLNAASEKAQNGQFKIVRIKNKLDEKDNNILINYVFMNKFQCELQLSLTSHENMKEKNYNIFSHFLYELCRGQFGVLSECATIISHSDPLMGKISQELNYYIPKNTPILIKNISKLQARLQKALPMICKICNKIQLINNPGFFTSEKPNQMACHACIQKQFHNSCPISSLNFAKDKNIFEQIALQGHADKFSPLNKKEYSNKIGFYISREEKYAFAKFFRTIYLQIEQTLIICIKQNHQWINLFRFTGKNEDFQKINKDFYFEILNSAVVERYLNPSKQLSAAFQEIASIPFQQFQEEICYIENIKYIKGHVDGSNQTLNLTGRINFQRHMAHYKKTEAGKKKPKRIAIQYFIAQETEMKNIPEWLPALKNLKQLNLNSNLIEEFKPCMIPRKNLIWLSLRSNQISKIDLKEFSALKHLDLSLNQLQYLSLEEVPEIRTVKAYSNLLQNIHFGESKKLESILLSANQLKEIHFHQWPEIKYINISDNKLSDLKLGEWAKLQILILCCNEFKKIQIPNYSELKIIALDSNKLVQFKTQDWPNLRVLNVSMNQIPSIQTRQWPSLEKLMLARNQIQHIQTYEWTKLIEFYVCFNQFKALNISINQHMKMISVTHCLLESLEVNVQTVIHPKLEIRTTANPSLPSKDLDVLKSKCMGAFFK